MNQGINKAQLMGQVGADPVYRATATGTSVASFSLATNESWKDENGERKSNTEWHKVVVYKRLAEIVRDYVKKGSRVLVEGPIKTRKWKDKTGTDRITTEIVCRDIYLLDRKDKVGPVDDVGEPEIDNGMDDIPF